MNTKKKKHKIAILGYTSDYGKELKEYIEKNYLFGDHEFLFFDFSAVDDYSIIGEFREKPVLVKYPHVDEIKDIDLLVVAGAFPQNSDVSKLTNATILDLTSLIEPFDYVTDGLYEKKKRVFRLAHPLSIISGKFLQKLSSVFGIEYVNMTGLFPASFKNKGIEALFEQTIDVLNMKEVDSSPFQGTLAFDFLPVESKDILLTIENEIKNIYGINNTFVHGFYVPVFHSITVEIFFKTKKTIDEDVLKYTFDLDKNFEFERSLTIKPSEISGKEKIFISSLRVSREIEKLYHVSITADNYLEGIIKPSVEFIENFLSQND